MVNVKPDEGRNFVEEATVDGISEVLDTVAVGTGDTAPTSSDTSLDAEVYSVADSNGNVTVEKTTNTGEIRFVVEVTGGTEVPAGTEIIELGALTTDDRLFYREVRSSPITVGSGETKVIEFRTRAVDEDTSSNSQAITTDGLDRIANIILGNSSDIIDVIAVGDSTNDVSASDTSMFSELTRDNSSSIDVTIESTSNVGEPEIRTTVAAGSDGDDDVAGGSNISEFGLIAEDGLLVFHETRTPLTLEADDEKAFTIPFTTKR